MEEIQTFELPKFEPKVFFSAYWRKRPLLVRNGAIDFLGRNWSAGDFGAVCVEARASNHPIMERDGEVTFIENVSAFDSDLAERAAILGPMFGTPGAWFDGVQTHSSSGIGAHFDHSDNFVLQQDGVKEWTLAAPKHIGRTEIARRMVNLPGVGGHPMPETDFIRFTLRPGDMLYIPLLWLHSGLSLAPSLSLSLVCPAVSLYSAVVPFLTQVLKRQALGYQPIPAFHSQLSEDGRKAAVEALRKATRAFIGQLSNEEILSGVHQLQEQLISGGHTGAPPEVARP